MKKFLATVVAVVLVALAIPAFAATNPFMDVPLNHWAYDAIGQLAANGILAGFPDGTYKGRQPTTRYEMASAIARTLGYIDLNKASKQDVEMMKRLIVEFRDELDALGVRMDELDDRNSSIGRRLNGWRISGVMRFDIQDLSGTRFDTTLGQQTDYDNWAGRSRVSRARLLFERWYGENESIKLTGRFNINNASGTQYELFNVSMPFFGNSRLTVGRFVWDKEANYWWGGSVVGLTVPYFGHDAWLSDRYMDGIAWEKSIGLGGLSAYVTRVRGTSLGGTTNIAGDPHVAQGFGNMSAWEFFAMAEMQFTERLAFDAGVQYFMGDDATLWDASTRLNSLYTVFGGLRFDWRNNIALKGMYYYQKANGEEVATGNDLDGDSVSAYRVILDLKQGLLKFTNLWLEYNYLEQGFFMPGGSDLTALYLGNHIGFSGATSGSQNGSTIAYDNTIYRIGAMQQWNPKWRTMAYYALHTWNAANDPSMTQWALGVQYSYTPNVTFGLAYSKYTFDDEAYVQPTNISNTRDLSVIHFRTEITF